MPPNITDDLAATRRQFLKAAALVIGFYVPEHKTFAAGLLQGERGFAPNAFLRIDADSTVTVISKHIEVGQGVYTGLATMLAEELDAAWSQVRVEAAPADDNLYKNLRLGVQATCCSVSTMNSFEQYRQAGALARAMLVAAAAQRWQVPANEVTVESGLVKHLRSSQAARFGDLATLAATMPQPARVTLKDPKNFRLIGAPHLPRIDSKAKCNGSALFPIDVSLSDMVIASVEQPPWFGALPKSFDAAAAKSVPGVIEIVPLSGGVAMPSTASTW